MTKMKAIVGSALGLSLLLPATTAGAVQGKGKSKPKQEVSGSILLPAPFVDDSGCFAGLHRRVTIMSGGTVNGVIGYHFDIDKKTYNKPFNLEVTAGTGEIDLDITFYQSFGTMEQVLTDPAAAGAPASISFATRSPGGESGKVPKGFPLAIICMYTGQLGQGANATFDYTAGAGVKIPK